MTKSLKGAKPRDLAKRDFTWRTQEELRAFHKTLKRVTKGDDSEHKEVPVFDVTSEG